MEKELYKNYCRAWDKFLKDENDYYFHKSRIISLDLDIDIESDLVDKIEERYGHSGFNARQFGPWTEILDKDDLIDPNFILPGRGRSFQEMTNTDKNIPSYWGKFIYSEFDKCSGIVIGYGYDFGDDYILIEKLEEGGKKSSIMVNSPYKVFDTEEELIKYINENKSIQKSMA